jgi:phosphoribosylanthranilate isomerase
VKVASGRVHVKVCGLTTEDDARMVVDLGASAIGLNLVPASPRRVTVERAAEIVRAVGDRALVVLVVADLPLPEIRALLGATGARCVQLHGDEPAELVEVLLPHAYKAVRVRDAADAARLEAYPGEFVLADAKVDGVLGGTGATFDWTLVAGVARRRKLTLAGGLTAENVGRAIAVVRPFCVDVASGVEEEPGRKSSAKVAAFLRAARKA